MLHQTPTKHAICQLYRPVISALLLMGLVACQTSPSITNSPATSPAPTSLTPTNPANSPTASLAPANLAPTNPLSTSSTPTPVPTSGDIAFAISGKIGMTTIKDGQTQAGSAFYSWGQQGDRFAIDLTGALGLGATAIRYDGQTASLHSDTTGTITASSPEELLVRATGWQAPISYLPYWIVGKAAPSDSHSQYHANRLTSTQQGDWIAYFDYDNSQTPTRLRIHHADGHRVVMTIVNQP